MEQGHQFVLVAAPDARPYVRMVTERLFPTLARAVASSRSRAASTSSRWERSRETVAPDTVLAVFLMFCRIGGA